MFQAQMETAFPLNVHTRKLGDILVFYAVLNMSLPAKRVLSSEVC